MTGGGRSGGPAIAKSHSCRELGRQIGEKQNAKRVRMKAKHHAEEDAEVVLLACPGQIGWRIGADTPWEGPPDAVVICAFKGNPHDQDYLSYTAAQAGWWYMSACDRWFEPRTTLPEPRVEEDVHIFALNHQTIRYGYICFKMSFAGVSYEVQFDDVEDDIERAIHKLVAFTRAVSDRADVCELTLSHVHGALVVRSESSDWVRIAYRQFVDRPTGPRDTVIRQETLTAELKRFCRAVADHPAFGLMWVSFMSLTGSLYDQVLEQVEEERKGLVAAGFLSDDHDAQEAYEIARQIALIPIPNELRDEVSEYQRILRDLSG